MPAHPCRKANRHGDAADDFGDDLLSQSDADGTHSIDADSPLRRTMKTRIRIRFRNRSSLLCRAGNNDGGRVGAWARRNGNAMVA